jgi:hypothetical protein
MDDYDMFDYDDMMGEEGGDNENFDMYYNYESDDEPQQATYTEAQNLSYQGLGQDFGIDNVTGKRLINRSPEQIFLTKLIDTAIELNKKILKKPKKAEMVLNNFIIGLDPFIRKFTGTDSTLNESLRAMDEEVNLYIKNPAIKKQQLNYACFLIALAIKKTWSVSAKNFKILCDEANFGSRDTILVIDNIHVKSIDIFRYLRFMDSQS